ncbi:uncharacterized protein LOC143354425 isoform X2 [Halictus rubicundus]|uniref:uncharacterized protein LOC143354425 isoform X2 n=1 Tax=Halictus rubicundus TaxID=77578 RepID=UPI0040350464
MTPTRTVVGLSRLLVLVPVTVCATISYVSQEPPRCQDRTPPPQTLAKCQYDDDCMKNAYCWNQEACLCKDGYIVHKNRTHTMCLQVANAIGDACEVDIQCRVIFAPFSECRQNICQCSDGTHYELGRCYESVGLGKYCKTNHNCYIKDSYCVTGFCACTYKHHPNPRNDGCIPSKELGDNCVFDYDCVAESSRCILGACTCKLDHVTSSDGKQCLKAAKSVGEPCQEDTQCQLNLKDSKCGADGKCVCYENFHQRGSNCFKDVVLNERCLSHKECVTPSYRDSFSIEPMNVECRDGVCLCAPNYIMTEELRDCIGYSDNGGTTTTIAPLTIAWQTFAVVVLMRIATF